MKALYKGKWRTINDGGGLCSPGRWPVSARRWQKSEAWAKFQAVLRKGFLRWVLETSGARKDGKDAVAETFWRMAGGKMTSSPFHGSAAATAGEADALLLEFGIDARRRPTDQCSEINFRRLAGGLELLRDPDYAYLVEIAERGVRIGVGSDMPRVPAVFEEKTKWNREFVDTDMEPEQIAANYASAREHMSVVRRQVEEEVQKGLVERMSLEEARARFPGRLAIAALGAVPKDVQSDKPDLVRVVFDGSYSTDINSRIKVLDQVRSPIIDDIGALQRQIRQDVCEKGQCARFALLYDIAMAHRLVPVCPEDWGLQAFSLDDPDEVFVHRRGTFGIASAGYWWARVASGAVRLCHALADCDLAVYHLLYSDDGWLTSMGDHFWRRMLFWLFVLEVFEIPISWRKVRGGTEVQWIGYQLSVATFSRGISSKKVKWFTEWLHKHVAAGGVMGRDFQAVLGRLSFVGGALQHVRPFLGPLFAWNSVLRPEKFAKFPLAVLLVLRLIQEEISRCPMQVVERIPVEEGDFFRVDAKADKTSVVIGGWESMGGCLPRKARWFSVRLDRKTAPWVFAKGEPFRVIASLELLAVVVAVIVFGQDQRWWHRRGQLWLPAITDNLGNSFVLERFMSCAFPLSMVLMELSAQLGHMDLHLQLNWVPRDQNTEADALTNECFDEFNPDLRIPVCFESLPFLVLTQLMQAAQELDDSIQFAKTSKEAKAKDPLPRPKRRKTSLRWTEPW